MLIIKGKEAESKRIRKSCDYFLLTVCQVSSNLETVLTNNDSIYKNPGMYILASGHFYSQTGIKWLSRKHRSIPILPA